MGLISGILGGLGVPTDGLIGQIGNGLSSNSNMLLGLATGGGQGAIQGARVDALDALQQRQENEKKQQIEAAASFLKENGFNPAYANSPAAMQMMMQLRQQKEMAAERAADNDRAERHFQLNYDLQKNGGPSEMARILRDQGIDPASPEGRSFAQRFYANKLAPQAPSGYRPKADGTLEPIPGGPADPASGSNKAIPAEIASKFGLVDQYEKAYPRIEADLTSEDPSTVGIFDQPRAEAGIGAGGAIYRDMKLGSEAMVRLLTGAGRSESEARDEVKQYLPSIKDNAASLLDKQRRLRAALRSMQRQVMRGRMAQEQIDQQYPEIDQPAYGSGGGTASAVGKQGGKGLPSGSYDYVPGKGLVPRQ